MIGRLGSWATRLTHRGQTEIVRGPRSFPWHSTGGLSPASHSGGPGLLPASLCGICGVRSGTGAGSRRVLRYFPVNIIAPLLCIHSCILWGWTMGPLAAHFHRDIVTPFEKITTVRSWPAPLKAPWADSSQNVTTDLWECFGIWPFLTFHSFAVVNVPEFDSSIWDWYKAITPSGWQSLGVLDALVGAKDTLWARPCLSVCPSRVPDSPHRGRPQELDNLQEFPKARSNSRNLNSQGPYPRGLPPDVFPKGTFPNVIVPSDLHTFGPLPQGFLPVDWTHLGLALPPWFSPISFPPRFSQLGLTGLPTSGSDPTHKALPLGFLSLPPPVLLKSIALPPLGLDTPWFPPRQVRQLRAFHPPDFPPGGLAIHGAMQPPGLAHRGYTPVLLATPKICFLPN
jgi:hypothetical protein